MLDELRVSSGAGLPDVTEPAFGQLLLCFPIDSRHDYWQTVLDSASGIDIYDYNGVSIADIDGDGFDDLYICQPAGIPNRRHNRGDGNLKTLRSSPSGVLENTACALFGPRQRRTPGSIVVRANGPLLFLNAAAENFGQAPAF